MGSGQNPSYYNSFVCVARQGARAMNVILPILRGPPIY